MILSFKIWNHQFILSEWCHEFNMTCQKKIWNHLLCTLKSQTLHLYNPDPLGVSKTQVLKSTGYLKSSGPQNKTELIYTTDCYKLPDVYCSLDRYNIDRARIYSGSWW